MEEVARCSKKERKKERRKEKQAYLRVVRAIMASLTLRLACLPLDVPYYNHAIPLISTQIPLTNPYYYANHRNLRCIITCDRVPIFSSTPSATTTWISRVSSSSSPNHSSALLCFGAARGRSSSHGDYERLSVESGVSSEANEKIVTSTEPYLADNFSAILNYEDLCKHLEPTIFKEEVHTQ